MQMVESSSFSLSRKMLRIAMVFSKINMKNINLFIRTAPMKALSFRLLLNAEIMVPNSRMTSTNPKIL